MTDKQTFKKKMMKIRGGGKMPNPSQKPGLPSNVRNRADQCLWWYGGENGLVPSHRYYSQMQDQSKGMNDAQIRDKVKRGQTKQEN